MFSWLQPRPTLKPSEAPAPDRRRRRRQRHRLFALGIVAVLLLTLEICVRAMFPLPEVAGFNRVHYQHLVRSDARTASLTKRGLVYDRLKFESRNDGFSEVHRLNLYGFRGPDFDVARSRRRRVLILGDSIVEGVGAPESATIPAVFAELLRNDGDPAEVINLGVVAASLTEITPLARDAIDLLKPSDVVLVLYANDLPADPYPKFFDKPALGFPPGTGLGAMPRLPELLMRVVREEPIYRRWPPQPVVPFFRPAPDPTNPWTGATRPPPGLDPALFQSMTTGAINPWLWEQAMLIPGMLSHDFSGGAGSPAPYLIRIASLCEAAGARLVVAYVPFCGVTHSRYAPSLIQSGMDRAVAEALAVDRVYRRQNELLDRLCRRLGLPFADATDSLTRAEADGEPQYWTFDTHPRPAGYRTIARHIHDVWRSPAAAASHPPLP